jgi:hypothetical protein
MTEAPKKIVVDVAGAMDKITPEFIEMMAPLLTQPMIASLENEITHLRARVAELTAQLATARRDALLLCRDIAMQALTGDADARDIYDQIDALANEVPE